MNCWICVTNRANFEVVKREGVWGVADRYKNVIEQVEPGDTLLFYLMQERGERGEVLETAIGGAFQATSRAFRDASRVFRGDLYPHRVRVKPLVVPERPVPFKPLVPRLSFIKNKQKWSGHFRRAMVRIPGEDCALIVETLRVS